jgi:hypothetical protein
MECRFYCDNDKTIKTILSGARRCRGQPEQDWAMGYLKIFLQFKKLLEKKQ